MKEVYDFLKKSGVFYLATEDGDQPRVRPFGALNIYDDKLYIQTGKKKDVSKQISVNPNVEICAMNDGKWIRITGKVISDDRIDAKRDFLDNNPNLKKMYSADDDNTEVLYFKDATAIIYSFDGDPVKFKF